MTLSGPKTSLTPGQIEAIECRLSGILEEAETPSRAFGEIVLVVERGRIAGIRKVTDQRLLEEMRDVGGDER